MVDFLVLFQLGTKFSVQNFEYVAVSVPGDLSEEHLPQEEMTGIPLIAGSFESLAGLIFVVTVSELPQVVVYFGVEVDFVVVQTVNFEFGIELGLAVEIVVETVVVAEMIAVVVVVAGIAVIEVEIVVVAVEEKFVATVAEIAVATGAQIFVLEFEIAVLVVKNVFAAN